MADAALEFEQELEVFRTEAEAAAQFYYSYLTIHAVARRHQRVHRLLNRSALFWNTVLAGLQTSTFIVLGRIFDQSSPHNVYRVLRIAQDHPDVFSRAALAKRKQADLKSTPTWLREYLEAAYVPKAADFRGLRTHVQRRRRIYDEKYGDLRDKVFAHKDVTDQAAINALFEKTNVGELQQLLVFFSRLYDALWQQLFNGRKPVLRPHRYSVTRMLDRPSPPEILTSAHERITHEAERFLRASAGMGQRRQPRVGLW